MPIHIVRLGTPRIRREGLRIGTVRFPPRGVPKTRYASGNWYDVWMPDLAPSPATVKFAHQAKTDADWRAYERRYRREMAAPERRRLLDLLAALSKHADFSVGCYCDNERRCHRTILKSILKDRGAVLA
ncbi:MAG TPA: DUF488 family protein [Candidatus Polarisedimenticolia bacterium]|jgi:uncharacterized protein YeaO (DUF488 family)|nr:DUF488 family protein [Candidatus Polarisedimenticolia bacterium]